jgi:hypothetical protein
MRQSKRRAIRIPWVAFHFAGQQVYERIVKSFRKPIAAEGFETQKH